MYTLTYATLADFRAYAPMMDYLSDTTVNRRLYEAEFDVDSLFAGRDTLASGRRWDPSNRQYSTLGEATALERAVCAQAEWRESQGDSAFASPGQTIEGPDFTIKGSTGRYGLKTLQELRYAGMLITGTRAVAG